MQAVLAVIVLSDLCLGIRVPVTWNGDSEVKDDHDLKKSENRPKIPNEYFVYTAKKPQFAVDVAAFHGVQSPAEHYKSYPVRPYTGKHKPELGKHKIFDSNNPVFQNFQEFAQFNQPLTNKQTNIEFEVFHPYKAEEPALNQIYKDPVLNKIRDDIRDSQYRLQKYEKDAGKPNISSGEYLESPEQTDRKKIPQRNKPAPYEIHRPQRKPIYYRHEPIHNHREQVLNQRFKHPWNIHYAKIIPASYRPLRNHLSNLRQNHAMKYDDERNQYPQLLPPPAYSEPVDGYDIYERGKDKYNALRNNVDESINNAILENKPVLYQKLEMQKNDDTTDAQIENDEDEEFVPVKNYAQVRKSETYKHLPKSAAFDDAASFDEIKNAPRLREAIKSTKAQTVYSEEGYEDAAYDHAGELKHASENEGHAGYLKEKEISGGNYKAPSFSNKYQDGSGNAYQDQTLHGEQWQNNDKNKEAESDVEDYSEDDQSIESDIYVDVTGERNKRENNGNEKSLESKNSKELSEEVQNRKEEEETQGEGEDLQDEKEVTSEEQTEVGRIKRENDPESIQEVLINDKISEGKRHASNFKVPEINYTTTFLNDDELVKIAKLKIDTKKESLKDKYPYYFKDLISVHKHSPLRYAENLKFIPKKSNGGTEFYDSRSQFECPEVDEEVDVLPEKLKKDGHPDEGDNKNDTDANKKNNFEIKDKRRLKGLGDKIDCFKAKFFGENPLDSPFFKEEKIEGPEPITAPNLPVYKLKNIEIHPAESVIKNVFSTSEKLKNETKTEIRELKNKLSNGQNQLQESLLKNKENLKTTLLSPFESASFQSSPFINNTQSYVLDNIKSIIEKPVLQERIDKSSKLLSPVVSIPSKNISNNSSDSQQNVIEVPHTERKKRAAPFVYEPYKIIREGQYQDLKKAATNSNISSPLIKKLQSSKVIDRESEIFQNEQVAKTNATSRHYKDIGRQDRVNVSPKGSESTLPTFVDINEDKRRGEPRYELVSNVKNNNEGTDVQNHSQTLVTESQTNIVPSDVEVYRRQQQKLRIQRSKQQTTVKPYFDVSQFLPKSSDLHKPSASKKVHKIIKPHAIEDQPKNQTLNVKEVSEKDQNSTLGEDYEEYYDEEEQNTATTTTTSAKPLFKKHMTTKSTTTAHPPQEKVTDSKAPKLRLVTRFRDVPSERLAESKNENIKESSTQDDQINTPKYHEKKKTSSKSTLVTDTNSYGDVDSDKEDDMREREIDSMIGIKQDMDDYTPLYEKEDKQKRRQEQESQQKEEDYDGDEELDEDDEEDDEEEDDDDEDEDSSEYEEEEKEPDEKEIEVKEPNQSTTTPEPTKRTLLRTTEAPPSTTEARSAKLELRPIITKKKIEIHNEIPVNKSSPHRVQFKQDIKEIEIIKEMPPKPIKRKLNKNAEVLDLYKDDNLAKEINKLGDVEVFKENLDVKSGPKHGGNYRSAKLINRDEEISVTPQNTRTTFLNGNKPDTVASQSKNTKLIEFSENPSSRKMHGGNLRALEDYSVISTETPSKYNKRKSQKLIELDDSSESDDDYRMHGGNFKSTDKKSSRRRGEKLEELEDSSEDESEKSITQMHGGNLRAGVNRPIKRNRNEKLTDSKDNFNDDSGKLKTQMHGGHLKANVGRIKKQNGRKNEKLVKFDDSSEIDSDESGPRMHGGNLKSNYQDRYEGEDEPANRMHGGNYKSYDSENSDDETGNKRQRAKLVQATTHDKDEETSEKNIRNKAARLLNSFAQAAPILTTTPAYILDPSKRMYYYVDD